MGRRLCPIHQQQAIKVGKRDFASVMQENKDGDKEEDSGEEDEYWFLDVDLEQLGLDREALKKSSAGFNITEFV